MHNHYCLHDTGLLHLLPAARERGIGLINGAPLASGLLTDAGPPDWHPADAEARAVFRDAAAFCRAQGTDIGTLALQFASQHPDIPTTLFSAATREQVDHNVRNYDEPYDRTLVAAVQRILEPVRTQQWSY